MDNILVTNNISKVYGEGANAVTALHPLSLKVRSGSIHVILGKSGSGKTTLLHLLAGMDKPSRGTVQFRGQDISSLSDVQLAQLRGAKYGFVFQFFHLVPELSVYDNIALPAIFAKRKVTPSQINDLAASLGILGKVRFFPNELSGGEKQRVAIARAMINEPDILFADEPTGNLDQQNSNQVMDLLLKLCKRSGTTLIMVTHNESLVPNPDFLYWMEDGKLKQL